MTQTIRDALSPILQRAAAGVRAAQQFPARVRDAADEAVETSRLFVFGDQTPREPFTRAPPRHWRAIETPVQGTEHFVYHAPEKSKAVGNVVLMTGCESNPILYMRMVDHFNKAGFPVWGAPLVSQTQVRDNARVNDELNEWILLDPNSPLNRDADPSLPLHVICHSAGLLHTLRTLRDPENAARLLDRGAQVDGAAGFLDAAKASLTCPSEQATLAQRVWRQISSRVYGGYAQIFANSVLGETAIDRFFLYMQGPQATQGMEESKNVRLPLHSEAIQLRALGRSTVAELERIAAEEPGHPLLQIPKTFFISHNDPAACPRVARHVADLINAEVVECDVGHYIIPGMAKDILAHVRGDQPPEAEPETLEAEALPAPVAAAA